jgi:pimeloyl-ACP methyl ester carboxylesterase
MVSAMDALHARILMAAAPFGLALVVACGAVPPEDAAPDQVVPVDAGPGADATIETDAATPDALPGETPRADVPAIACNDKAADVYVTPGALAPMTSAFRGSVLRCAKEQLLSSAEIAKRLQGANVTGISATSETTVYRIAYRTYREEGTAGISTARVYLPTKQRSGPLPVIAVAHPTVGIADKCAPSEDPGALNDVALPWAARGFAVIAPDYAGLGNEGVHGYTANHDTAHSLLDGARALRAMLAKGAVDNRVVLAGYSQGGGAVLAAQGLSVSYGAGGDVIAAIVFAPEFFSRMNSFGYVRLLRAPDSLTILSGVSKPVVAAFRNYSASYNVLGAASAGLTFPAAKRAGILDAIEAQCQTPFGGYLQATAPYVRDLFDEGFRTSMLACIDGAATGCTGVASQLHSWLESDLVAPDPKGPPVLYIQGLLDPIMPPSEEAACNLGLLKKAGVSTQMCTDGTASHTNVVPRNTAFALEWAEAKLDGKATPACSADGLPACVP